MALTLALGLSATSINVVAAAPTPPIPPAIRPAAYAHLNWMEFGQN